MTGLVVDEFDEKIKEQNAIINSYSLNIEDGFLNFWLYLDLGNGSNQGFGGWCLQSSDHNDYEGPAGYYIKRVMEIGGVKDLSDIIGKTIRIRGTHMLISEIGHIIKDDWFNPVTELFNKLKK